MYLQLRKSPASRKALFLLGLFGIHLLTFGLYAVTAANDPISTPITNSYEFPRLAEGHSSPYYFPITQDSPLISELSDESAENNEQPNAAYYDSYLYTMTMHLNRYALTPGQDLTIDLTQFYNLSRYGNSQIQLQIYRGYYRYYYYYYYDNYYNSQQIYSVNVDTNNQGEKQITIPGSSLTQPGMYSIVAYGAGGQYAYADFSVGDLGLYFKGPAYAKPGHIYQGSLHLVDITDFSPLNTQSYNYTLAYFDYRNYQWVNLLTGNESGDQFGYGQVEFTLPKIEHAYAYYSTNYRLQIQAQNGTSSVNFETYIYESWDYYYYSLWGGKQSTNEDRYQFVVTTDKPIYTPGETVHLRALVWDYSYQNATKIAISESFVRLTIYNPENIAIYWTNVRTDAQGVLVFDFPLDADIDIGSWGIEFEYQTTRYRYTVKIDQYVKPVFRVVLDTDGKEFFARDDSVLFKNSEKFEGKIRVNYYFGQAVVDAAVILKILDYSDAVQFTFQGKTNAEGILRFSINLDQIRNIEYSFKTIVDVTDNYGRVAHTEKRYTRMDELYVYGYVDTWAPKIDETLNYYFSAYQLLINDRSAGWWMYDYNPLKNVSAEIKIYGVRSYPVYFTQIRDKEFVKSYTGQTNAFGMGQIRITLNRNEILPYHFFEIAITITLEDGRTASSSSYFRYQRYKLEMQVLNPSIQPGDTLQIQASYKDQLTGNNIEGEGYIYLYDSDYRAVTYGQIILSSPTIYSVKLPTNTPAGNYYLSSYVYSRSNNFFGGYEYHSSYLQFSVGNAPEFTLETNATINELNPYYGGIKLGQILEISGKSTVSSNIPLYLGIYKRGLLELTQIELINNQFTVNLPILDTMIPQITIQLYTISDNGKIYETSIVLKVEQEWNFTITTDKEIYEPGDMVTLSITPHGMDTLLTAISFIDSAVLDVEPEDDSELGYFQATEYWSYIQSSASWGNGISWNYYWWGYSVNYGGYYGAPMEDEGMYQENAMAVDNTAGGSQTQKRTLPSFEDLLTGFTTEVRDNVTESANWLPKQLITGPMNLTFQLPDNIGEWTIRVVGSANSWGAVESITIKTFLPFFVEFDIVEPVRQDDIIGVKAYIYNYLGSDVEAYVSINSPNLAILNLETQLVRIPNNFVTEVEFTVLLSEAYQQNITIIAATTVDGVQHSDGRLEKFYVIPNGLEQREYSRGYLNSSLSEVIINLTQNPTSIYTKAYLTVYTSLWDTSLAGWESLIGYPYGCIEQTMSKLLPTALVYAYLNTTGQLTPELSTQLDAMIAMGLARIYGFQMNSGAWGWWDEDTANIQMTATVLHGLNQIAAAGFMVNPDVIGKAQNFLFGQQSGTFSWTQEYSALTTLELTALVLRALIPTNSSVNVFTSQERTKILNSVSQFQTQWQTLSLRTPYAASLYYLATHQTPLENQSFNSGMVTYLLGQKQTSSSGTYWQGENAWAYLGGATEITALAILCLTLEDHIAHFPIIRSGVEYLLNQRTIWGWANTADTVAAIQLLTTLNTQEGGLSVINYTGNFSVSINNATQPQYSINFNEGNVRLPGEIGIYLQNQLSSGENQVKLVSNGNGTLYYTIEFYQVVRPTPAVTLPENIETQAGGTIRIPITLTGLPTGVKLTDIRIKLQKVDPIFREAENLRFTMDTMENNETIFIELTAPNRIGEYSIGRIKIEGYFSDNETTELQGIRKNFRQDIGPIVIKVIPQASVSGFAAANEENVNTNLNTRNQTPKAAEMTLSLSKFATVPSIVKTGAIVTVEITINNPDNALNYYALQDEIPSGCELVTDSVQITGSSTYTMDNTRNMINLFFNSIPTGEISIRYQIRVVAAKNIYLGFATLWGMYDETKIMAASDILDGIPKLYFSNATLYRDLTSPILSIHNYEQLSTSDTKVQINARVTDDAPISAIRVVFRQDAGWRSQELPLGEFNPNLFIILDQLTNIDSELVFYIEAIDIYGNIETSALFRLPIRSTLIPIVAILILGVSAAAIAGVASWHSRRLYKNTEPIRIASESPVDFVEKEDLHST
jgi:hypothetical protein